MPIRLVANGGLSPIGARQNPRRFLREAERPCSCAEATFDRGREAAGKQRWMIGRHHLHPLGTLYYCGCSPEMREPDAEISAASVRRLGHPRRPPRNAPCLLAFVLLLRPLDWGLLAYGQIISTGAPPSARIRCHPIWPTCQGPGPQLAALHRPPLALIVWPARRRHNLRASPD